MKKLPILKVPQEKKKTTIKDINRKPKTFTYGKPLLLQASENREKQFILQPLISEDGEKFLRICYYIIGKKGNRKGKWTWGQFAPFILEEDLFEILQKAKKEGVIDFKCKWQN